jgi:hypothetical protein
LLSSQRPSGDQVLKADRTVVDHHLVTLGTRADTYPCATPHPAPPKRPLREAAPVTSWTGRVVRCAREALSADALFDLQHAGTELLELGRVACRSMRGRTFFDRCTAARFPSLKSWKHRGRTVICVATRRTRAYRSGSGVYGPGPPQATAAQRLRAPSRLTPHAAAIPSTTWRDELSRRHRAATGSSVAESVTRNNTAS